MNKTSVDCATGEIRQVALTAAEIDFRAEDTVRWLAKQAARQVIAAKAAQKVAAIEALLKHAAKAADAPQELLDYVAD
jgi:hypothetical protein